MIVNTIHLCYDNQCVPSTNSSPSIENALRCHQISSPGNCINDCMWIPGNLDSEICRDMERISRTNRT